MITDPGYTRNSFRIAMVAACPFPAAFASSGLIRELSIELARRGHEVHVVTYHLGLTGFNTDGIVIHRIPPVPFYRKKSSGLSFGKPILDLILAGKLLQVIRRYNIDLIHAHNYEAPAAALLARPLHRIPIVYHAHNTLRHELPSYFSSTIAQSIAQRAGRILDLTIPRTMDHIITLSRPQTEYLMHCGVDPERITLIEPAINASAFQGGDGERVRRSLGLEREPLLIYTGGLQPYQNCHALIDLLATLLPLVPSAVMIILARSSRADLEQYALRRGVLDHIRFVHPGCLAEERDYLAAADIAVLPRLHCIGFPVKLLNYLAAARPVVCFEGITEDVGTWPGLHPIKAGDINQMARTVQELLEHPSRALSEAELGRQMIVERFSWTDKIDAIEAIYRRLCPTG